MRLILCLLSLILLNSFSCSAETHELPFLKIYFDEVITKGMEYSNGSMQLTDENGAVVELPAKFKI